MILCVYALVSPPPAHLNLPGVGGERLKVITIDRIGAIVGELRRAPAPSVRNLRRYAAAVEAIAAKTSATLPARYATTVADTDELTVVIRSRRAALRHRLTTVRGRAQMTVRLLESESGDAAFPSQSTVTSRTRLRLGYGATQGTQYLRQKVADAAAARAVPAFDRIRPAIRTYVKDERVEKRGGVVTINHLVPRGAAERYRDIVERAADEQALRLVVTGPWPPYAFADTW
ncbi:MAG TPA: GvpL/GvpF family gas vesicle protein [Vicinamibacterales bacterium]|nr:GvpL/GvpF family gas vesicle protein [Vicinamibacterales bacterium]